MMGKFIQTYPTFYAVISDHGPDGLAFTSGNVAETMDDAADQASESERLTGRDARVIRIDLDAGTAVDVTQESADLCIARLVARGWAAE